MWLTIMSIVYIYSVVEAKPNPFTGATAQNSGGIPFSLKFVLSFLPKDNLVTKKGNFLGLYSGRGIPKIIFYCGG
jgi:hypothetical protein